VLLARTADKARAGRARAEQMAKSDSLGRFLTTGSYDEDLEREVSEADLVFEAVSEEISLKRTFFERIDARRRPGAIVATVSSGLSIAGMCAGRSEGFKKHFLGIHLFNPPNVILGCELIPHAGTDPEVTAFVSDLLLHRTGRELVRTSDTPAFCGNRVGFRVLNECAQLAETHGPAYVDALVGPHTGRAMPPLRTIDFVGWDVHRAIVDNLHAHTRDEAHTFFAMPAGMLRGLDGGLSGDKSERGGFFRRGEVLDLATTTHQPAPPPAVPEVAARMKRLHRVGRYREAFEVFADATGPDAELMRRVILGYVSYGLCRVGEVVERAADVDRIMGFGFNWAPPSVLVDLVGARRTVALLEAAKLRVPAVVSEAAERRQPLFREPNVDIGRFFSA
jgi:3-hydroxyacyl-CoA dehydrogenase